MAFAWAVFIPAGYIFARFLRHFNWWFPLHIAINVFAIVLMIVALGLAVYSTPDNFLETITIEVIHSWVGIFILGAAAIQPFLGWWADKKVS